MVFSHFSSSPLVGRIPTGQFSPPRNLMATETRTTDHKARVSLPKSFANATVLIEQVSETEVRIRKGASCPRTSCGSPRNNRRRSRTGTAMPSWPC